MLCVNLQSYYRSFCKNLQAIYPEKEAGAISDLVFAHYTGLSCLYRITSRDIALEEPVHIRLDAALTELLGHRPVQYVLGTAWFGGIPFRVNEQVLIPRPETEELADWVIREAALHFPATFSLADLGTGSGCLAVFLKSQLPRATIFAADISPEAGKIALENARLNGVEIQFLVLDLLDPNQDKELPAVDMIVSNPPYITEQEKKGIERHVLDYEPHQALFVPRSDPLLFYRAILRLSQTKLNSGGMMFVEINESFADQSKALFEGYGFRVEVRKDLQGKDRMLKACRPESV